jgi:hypothetical protein
MCDCLGIAQNDPFTPQYRRDCVYPTVFLRPRLKHSARSLKIEDALSNTVEEALAGWSSELGSAELLRGFAEPSKEGPNCRAGDGDIERIPGPIGMEVGQNGVQDRPSRE